jgi:hypothetical protein
MFYHLLTARSHLAMVKVRQPHNLLERAEEDFHDTDVGTGCGRFLRPEDLQ